MSMENSNQQPSSIDQSSNSTDISQIPTGTTQTNNTDAILNYDDSPHRAIKVEPTAEAKVFGKYKSLEDAHKGYQSAESKIREQGTELNKLKQQMEDYKPMESYSEDKWTENVNKWIEEKSLPEGMTYDANIPEINMLIKGFEKAGVSEKQAKMILSGAVERQMDIIKERENSIIKELGTDGMKKVSALQEYCNKLSPEDQAAFSGLFAFPYVESAQVDLLHRILIGEGERSIPTGVPQAAMKGSADIYQEIMQFRKANERNLMTDQGLQQQEEGMWARFNEAKKRGI